MDLALHIYIYLSNIF